MIRFVPILALALAVCAPPPGAGMAHAQTAQQRDSGASPRTLERRARNAAPEQRADLLRLAAQRWLERGERQRAILALDGAIQARPEDARLWQRRAQLHAAAGAHRSAIDDITRAIELDATRASAYRLRATLWRRIGARDMAAADLARATLAQQRRARPAAEARMPAHPAGATDAATLAALAPPRPLTPATAPDVAKLGSRAIGPDALDALTISATLANSPPRSLLPPAETITANGTSSEDAVVSPRPARSAMLESPALDAITIAAARLQTDPAPVSAHVASNQPLFPPQAQRGGLPAPPDPIEAHRRRMEAAAIVQRRIEAGEAMMAAMRAAPAGGLPDPSFRASTAPLPKIYRGTQIPAQLASRAGIAPNAAPNAGVGGPYLPVRKAAPPARQARAAAVAASTPVVAVLPQPRSPLPATAESFDATPANPMIEHGVAAPVVAVERGTLR